MARVYTFNHRKRKTLIASILRKSFRGFDSARWEARVLISEPTFSAHSQRTDGARFSIREVVMSIPERSPRFQVVLALLISTLSLLPLLAGQTRQVSTVWTVKYASGSEPISLTPRRKHFIEYLRQGDKIKVQLGKDEITFQRRKKVLLSIPITEVTQIAYDHKSHRLSKKVNGAMNGMSGNYGEGSGLILIGGVAAMIATLPFKYADYFVQILWQENRTMHSIEIKLGRKDCQAFLNELQNMANVQAGKAPLASHGAKKPQDIRPRDW